jgi:hypothetical protein
VELLADSLVLGELELSLATGLFVAGEPTASLHEGTLGFGVSVDALAAGLEALGVDPDTVALLSGLADLDTDGDGTDDAVSVALTFTAPACELQAP